MMVTEVPNVVAESLIPRNTWSDGTAYDQTPKKIADLFAENFVHYADGGSSEANAAGPIYSTAG